jgi:outer membrane protein
MHPLVRALFTCSMEELNNDHFNKIFYQKFFFMKCRKVLTVVIAMISGLVLSAQTGRKLSLRQAVEIGISKNLDVNRANLNRQRANINLHQAKGNMVPSLSGNINHNLNSGRSIDVFTNSYVNQEYTSATYRLNSDVTLFNGFRLWNLLRTSQLDYEAAQMEWQQAKDDLTLDIVLAYLQILNDQDQYELSRIQTAQMQQQVDRLQILHQQGAILPSDLTDLQGQLAQNKINEIASKNALATSKLTLVQLLNIPFDSTLQVDRLALEQFDMNYTAIPDSIFAIAMQQLAMAKAPVLRRQADEKFLKAQRGNLYPTLGFGAGIGTNFSSTGRDAANNKIAYYDQLRNNYNTGFGFGVNIPILNNWFFRNNVKRAKIDLKQSELEEENIHIQLKQIIERDYFNLQAAIERYKALVEQVAALNQSFGAAEARFNAGVTNSIDFLTARNNLDRANVNLILARYNYIFRTKILDFYQGRPLF